MNSTLMHYLLQKSQHLQLLLNEQYMNSSRNIWPVLREQCIHALFTNPQISFFINFFIKNGSHGTIDTFKNYFATVFSVFSFQFQQNKFYSNTPYDEQILHGEFKRQTPII